MPPGPILDADDYCQRQLVGATRACWQGLQQLIPEPGEFPRQGGDHRRELRREIFIVHRVLASSINLIEDAQFNSLLPGLCLPLLHKTEKLLNETRGRINSISQSDLAHDLNAAREMIEEVRRRANSWTAYTKRATRFLVLLISDLHFGQPDQETHWPAVEYAILEGLKKDLAENEHIDLVIFAGDLVHSGAGTEFKQVDAFLGKLWEVFEGSSCNPPMISIPGNHDLIVPNDPSEKEVAKIKLKPLTRLRLVDDFFKNKMPRDAWSILEKGFSTFQKWQNENIKYQAGEKKRVVSQSPPGLLPGDHRYRLTKGDYSIGFACFNTLFLHLAPRSPDDGPFWPKGDISLGRSQVFNCVDATWARENSLNVLVTHHPLDWMTSECVQWLNTEFFPTNSVSLHLHGHMHEPTFGAQTDSSGRSFRFVQAPALFGERVYFDKHKNEYRDRIRGYSLIQFSFEGNRRFYRIGPRVLSNQCVVVPAVQYCSSLLPDGWTCFIEL